MAFSLNDIQYSIGGIVLSKEDFKPYVKYVVVAPTRDNALQLFAHGKVTYHTEIPGKFSGVNPSLVIGGGRWKLMEQKAEAPLLVPYNYSSDFGPIPNIVNAHFSQLSAPILTEQGIPARGVAIPNQLEIEMISKLHVYWEKCTEVLKLLGK